MRKHGYGYDYYCKHKLGYGTLPPKLPKSGRAQATAVMIAARMKMQQELAKGASKWLPELNRLYYAKLGQKLILPMIRNLFDEARSARPGDELNLTDVGHKIKMLNEALVSFEAMHFTEDVVKTLNEFGARGKKLTDEAKARKSVNEIFKKKVMEMETGIAVEDETMKVKTSLCELIDASVL